MRAGTGTWRQWLDRHSVNTTIINKGLTVNSYPLLIEAAIQVHGIALDSDHLGGRQIQVSATPSQSNTGILLIKQSGI